MSAPNTTKTTTTSTNQSSTINSAANLSYNAIATHFRLPLHEACVALHVDESSLKKRCRELGIKRWPYRKRCDLLKDVNVSPKSQQQNQNQQQKQQPVKLFSCFQLSNKTSKKSITITILGYKGLMAMQKITNGCLLP
ncbi:hypothetical protein ABK040_014161 [Willaertia magna]